MMKLVKQGDRTLVVNECGIIADVANRRPNSEAGFAMDLILADQSGHVAGAVVERAFSISKLTFEHIKQHRMDTPFPFAKVYPRDEQ